jgi:serine/threonine protein kinase
MTRPIYNNHAENFRMPPEISSKESAYTSQCDIYSFGILMFHILTGYLNTNPINESGNISPMYTRQMPPACVNIIDMCCAMNANERPKFSVVVERIKTIFTTEMKDENPSDGEEIVLPDSAN